LLGTTRPARRPTAARAQNASIGSNKAELNWTELKGY
jgi:hypothetical protein